jgi:hypothetical protein
LDIAQDVTSTLVLFRHVYEPHVYSHCDYDMMKRVVHSSVAAGGNRDDETLMTQFARLFR